MEKTFSEILENAPWFSKEEAQQITEWANQFPYSQVLQVAAACAAWHLKWPDKQEWLHRAAVRSADRSTLKSWIERAQQEEPAYIRKSETTLPENDLAEAVMADIESLHQAMQRFEAIASSASIPPVTTKKNRGKTGRSKKERLLEAVRQLQEQQAAAASDKEQEIKPRPRKKRKSESDTILEEIESRQKIQTENHKTREQLEIIDRFIQRNPSISQQGEKADNEPSVDLTSAGQQPDFNEHIVSETLVDILLQQGKKDKAIEVLKKLIWKFPQKKTYFAARIDELKK